MSFDVQRNWLYQLKGRNIHLFQVIDSGNWADLGSGSTNIKVQLPEDYRGKSLIYPSEAITNGLRFDGTAFIEPFVDNDPNEIVSGTDNPTLTEVAVGGTSVDGTVIYIEDAHLNVSRLLSLAIIDYVKSMMADAGGNVQVKDYYMKEFWKKVGDDQSNRRRISMTFPSSPFALR
tara:strand:- start:964 stop:1488 length:525 start_codon:yes stop_codon:yes gene_type:complete